MKSYNYVSYRKNKILRYIDSIKYAHRIFPPSLQVSLSDYCVNKCITCSHWKMENKQIINYQVLIDFLEFGKKNNLETVCYSGGDPFIYKRLNEVMEWHCRNDIDFGFITSGHLSDFISLHLLSKSKWVRVSLDSIKNYNLCRGGILFENIDKSIKQMTHCNINVGLGITLHKHNYKEIKELFDYAIFNGIKEVRIWFVRGMPELNIPNNEYDIKPILDKYINKFEKLKISNNLNSAFNILSNEYKESLEFKNCHAVKYQLFIAASGMIYPCCITGGDTNDSSKCDSIGDISFISPKRAWDFVVENIEKFSRKNIQNLPEICRNNCILRLSSINHIVEKELKNKEFI